MSNIFQPQLEGGNIPTSVTGQPSVGAAPSNEEAMVDVAKIQLAGKALEFIGGAASREMEKGRERKQNALVLDLQGKLNRLGQAYDSGNMDTTRYSAMVRSALMQAHGSTADPELQKQMTEVASKTVSFFEEARDPAVEAQEELIKEAVKVGSYNPLGTDEERAIQLDAFVKLQSARRDWETKKEYNLAVKSAIDAQKATTDLEKSKLELAQKRFKIQSNDWVQTNGVALLSDFNVKVQQISRQVRDGQLDVTNAAVQIQQLQSAMTASLVSESGDADSDLINFYTGQFEKTTRLFTDKVITGELDVTTASNLLREQEIKSDIYVLVNNPGVATLSSVSRVIEDSGGALLTKASNALPTLADMALRGTAPIWGDNVELDKQLGAIIKGGIRNLGVAEEKGHKEETTEELEEYTGLSVRGFGKVNAYETVEEIVPYVDMMSSPDMRDFVNERGEGLALNQEDALAHRTNMDLYYARRVWPEVNKQYVKGITTIKKLFGGEVVLTRDVIGVKLTEEGIVFTNNYKGGNFTAAGHIGQETTKLNRVAARAVNNGLKAMAYVEGETNIKKWVLENPELFEDYMPGIFVEGFTQEQQEQPAPKSPAGMRLEEELTGVIEGRQSPKAGGSTGEAPDVAQEAVQGVSGRPAKPEEIDAEVSGQVISDSPESFVKSGVPIARSALEGTGISPELAMAVTALETGWGRSVKGGAYFGVKSHGKDVDTVEFGTTEFEDGEKKSIRDEFRAYDSFEEAVQGFAAFLRDNPRYAKVFETDDPEKQAEALAEAGYATDPEYANKLKSMIKSVRKRM